MSATNKLVRKEEQQGNGCGFVNDAMALIGDKWTAMVLGALGRKERLRYTELRRDLQGISQRMLTLRLKTLEENGLVKRTIFPEVPPRVEYEMTPLGRSLLDPVRAVVVWTRHHHKATAEARLAYAKSASEAAR